MAYDTLKLPNRLIKRGEFARLSLPGADGKKIYTYDFKLDENGRVTMQAQLPVIDGLRLDEYRDYRGRMSHWSTNRIDHGRQNKFPATLVNKELRLALGGSGSYLRFVENRETKQLVATLEQAAASTSSY